MSVKCAIFENTSNKDKPTYKEIDEYLGKGSKVIYGGGKRKNKNIPYADKLYLIENAFSNFEKVLVNNHSYTRELYLFESEANATALTLKFADNLTTHFVVDDILIDELSHLTWTHGHLVRFKREIESTIKSLDFFVEKDIGDAKFYKSFPAYTKANDKLVIEITNAIKRIEDNATLILKSGW
jgi:hypothetical protein